jgi:tetratricopeptide (TPR) repeat protein
MSYDAVSRPFLCWQTLLWQHAMDAQSTKYEGGHADDRIHCSSDKADAVVIECAHIIENERLDEFDCAGALKNHALHYQELGALDHAIDEYTKLLGRREQRKNRAKTCANRCLIYSNSIEALADFTNAATLDPKGDSAYVNTASILMNQSDLEGAIADLDRATQINPKAVPIHLSGASIYAYLCDYSCAVTYYSEAIEVDPENALTWRYRGYRALGDTGNGARDAAQALGLPPDMCCVRLDIGVILDAAGNSAEALEESNEAIHLNPGEADAYRARAKVYANSGDRNQAIADFTQAIQLNAGAVEPYQHRAFLRQESEDGQGAMDDYNRANKINLRDAESLGGHRFVHLRRPEADAAIADLTPAQELSNSRKPDEMDEAEALMLNLKGWPR